MNVKRLAIASILIWIVGTAWSFLTCGWLFNWVYEIPPIIWRTPEQMFTTGNLIGSNLLGILIAFIFVILFAVLYDSIPKEGVMKGLMYGFIIWLIGSFSGMVTLPFYMTIAWTVVIYWILNGLVAFLIYGAIAGAIYKE